MNQKKVVQENPTKPAEDPKPDANPEEPKSATKITK